MREPLLACSRLKCTLCSLIAVYMRTGALTRPNEMAPLQSARGMLSDRRRDDRSNVRIVPARQHDVEVGGQHEDRGREVEPAEQHDHEREDAVGARRMTQLARHV